MKKNSHLSLLFYRNFILLIVLPILLVIIIALWAMRSMMLETSMDNMKLIHDNVCAMLESEITDASLSLAQFVQSGNNRVLELITQYADSKDQAEKYRIMDELNQAYRVVFLPKSQIIAVQFVFKDGAQYCLKDDVVFSTETLREAEWYKNALAEPERVFISVLDTAVTFSTRNNYARGMPMVAAYSPQWSDRGGRVEMACLYMQSKTPGLLDTYNEHPEVHGIFLTDAAGKPIHNYPAITQVEQPVQQGQIGVTGQQGQNGETGQQVRQGQARQQWQQVQPERLAVLSALTDVLFDMPEGESTQKAGGKEFYCINTTLPRQSIRIVSVTHIQNMLKQFNRLGIIAVSVALLVFALFFSFSRIFLSGIVRPIDRLNAGMKRVQEGDLSFAVEEIGQKEIKELAESYNHMTGRIKALLETTRKQEQEKHQAEMSALQSQINPHFLVNTLNTMRFMSIAAKFDGLKNMSDALIKILSCLFKSQSGFYTVREEIDILKSYTYLMGIRYSDNFETAFDIPAGIMDCLVPRLILQPIVENAIIHGLAAKEEIGHIIIRAELRDGDLVFTVADDGVGMSAQRMRDIGGRPPGSHLAGIGIGINNVNRRIELIYGEGYGIQMDSAPEVGTTATLRMPSLIGGTNV